MKLYLIRHGEVKGNQEGRCVGWDPFPLTERGRRQAQALAQRLRPLPLTGVYSSDLARTFETATMIAEPHGLKVVPVAGLRETNFGEWAGLTYDEMYQRDPEALEQWLKDPEHLAPPGGETLAETRQRFLDALPRMDRVAVVSHGGPIRAVLAAWMGCSFWSVQVPPASLTELEWDGERMLQLVCLGDTSHLTNVS